MTRLATLPPRLAQARLPGARAPTPFKRTLPFYKSPEWRRLIASLIAERGRRCQDCGRTRCRIYGDHIEELQDGGAPFDPRNVRLLCGRCHNRKTAAAAAGRERWQDLIHPEGLEPSAVPLTIVCGPPASGKTTWVRERAAAGDLVIDLDVIKAQLSGQPLHAWDSTHLRPALLKRNELLRRLSVSPPAWPRGWLIVAEASATWREWWARQLVPQRIVVLETPDELCLARIALADDRAASRAEQSRAVMAWWNGYERRPGDEWVVPA